MPREAAMDYGKIKLSVEDGVAVIAFNDPATMNAAGIDTAEELTDAFRQVADGSLGVRAVILTGEGRGFCSGANLSSGLGGGKREAGSALETHYNPLMSMIRTLPVPLVTAVNGAAAGVGCSFALMGDMILAAESAYFLQAFRRIGLVPDGGSTYLLPRMIGRARAMEMMLLGERIAASKALEWGLINRCVPDAELMTSAHALAKALAEGPKSLGMIRQLVWNSLDAGWSDQLQAEATTQTSAGKTEDFAEGVQAFLQKRPAAFKGR
jgi:2-(1,2-epoxy-1,2-dihydrophenyl)acetyl-CoA isomerase